MDYAARVFFISIFGKDPTLIRPCTECGERHPVSVEVAVDRRDKVSAMMYKLMRWKYRESRDKLWHQMDDQMRSLITTGHLPKLVIGGR